MLFGAGLDDVGGAGSGTYGRLGSVSITVPRTTSVMGAERLDCTSISIGTAWCRQSVVHVCASVFGCANDCVLSVAPCVFLSVVVWVLVCLYLYVCMYRDVCLYVVLFSK